MVGIPLLENERVSWFPDILVSKFFRFLVSKFLGLDVSKIQGSHMTKNPFHVFWKILIPYARFPRTY